MSIISDNRNKRKQKQQRAQVVATTPKTPPQQTYSTPVGAETQGQGYQQYTTPQQQAPVYNVGFHPSGVDAGEGLVANHQSYQPDAMAQQAQVNAQGTASAPVMDVPTTQAPPPTQVGFHPTGIPMPDGYSATRPSPSPDAMPQGQSSAPYQGQLDNAVNGVYARRMGGARNYATQPADYSTGAPVMEVARPTDKPVDPRFEPTIYSQEDGGTERQPYYNGYVQVKGESQPQVDISGQPVQQPQVETPPYQLLNPDLQDNGILSHNQYQGGSMIPTQQQIVNENGVTPSAMGIGASPAQQNVPEGEDLTHLERTNRLLAGMEGQPQQQPKSKVDQQMDAIKQAQDAQAEKDRTTFNPKKKNVPSFLNGLLRAPRTEAERRDQITKITTLGNLLRHAANLYYVGEKDATPQTIADQNAINQAQWAAEDKAAADKAAKEAELARKMQKDANDNAYKQGLLHQGDQNIAIKMADAARKAKETEYKGNADRRAEELQPYNIAEKATGIAYKGAQAKKLEEETKWVAPKAKADINNKNASAAAHRASAANSYASAAQHRASTLKTLKEMDDNNVHSMTSGWYGTLNRDKKKIPLTDDNISSMYAYAVKNKLIEGIEPASGYANPSPKDMMAAVSDGLGGNDGRAQHLAHYLVNQWGFTLDDGSKAGAFGRADKIFQQREGKRQRVAHKTATASDYGGTKIK